MASFPFYTEPTHDAGTVAANIRNTGISNAENRIVVDAVDKIFLLEPSKHPLVTLLTNVGKVHDGSAWKGSAMQKAVTNAPTFYWFEDFYGGRYCKVSGTYAASGAITISVTGAGASSGYIFTVGDIVKNARTGENMRVNAVAATSVDITSAQRGFGTTAAAAGADGDGLFIVGNVNEENGSSRNINSTRTSRESNVTQIFRTTIGASRTEQNTTLYGGADLPYQRAKKGTEHALDIERAFWFGQLKDTTGTNGLPLRSTGGVLEWIESNNAYVQNQDGSLTAPDLNLFLMEGFNYGATEKFLFCGGLVLNAINEIARGQLRTVMSDKSYGVSLSQWVTAFGTVNLVHNKMFVQDYAGWAFLIDLDCLRYRFLANSDTKLRMNIQANDADGEVDEFLTEVGLERKHAAKCALLKGVTN